MLPWMVIYAARPVLAAQQKSYGRRHDAAAVTARES